MTIKVGQRFTCLEVVSLDAERASNGAKKALCRCDCGKEKSVVIGVLLSGGTKSCGCYKRRIAKRMNKKKSTLTNRYDTPGFILDDDFDSGEHNVGFI